MKIAYQGVAGSYSESCAKKMYPESETIPCKTFDECFERSVSYTHLTLPTTLPV